MCMARNEKRDLGLLFAFAAIILLAANGSLTITDPVESNYALTAKEMVASGNYISPRIFGNYWYDKPAFFYWEMIASCLIFGVNEFALRFPGVIMGLLSVALLYFFARRLYGHRTALLAGGLLASSVGFWYVGKAVITDMTLFFFMSATLVSFRARRPHEGANRVSPARTPACRLPRAPKGCERASSPSLGRRHASLPARRRQLVLCHVQPARRSFP